MDSKQLLRIDKWSRIIFIISSMLLIVLVIFNIFMEEETGFSKCSNVVGIIVSVVGLICISVATALKYAKEHDMNLQLPKEKKKDTEADVGASGDDDEEESDDDETTESKKNRKSSSGLSELSPVRVFANTASRLNREIQYQKYWSYANLIIFIVLTVIALALIVIYAFFAKSDGEIVPSDSETSPWVMFVINSLPRFCLVVFIEIIAMAFYKSHKSNLENIKYYQNEITSIESRRIALVTAIFTGNVDMQKECIKKLIEIDRNFKLQEGETTIELEKLKQEYDLLGKMLKSVKGILPVKE